MGKSSCGRRLPAVAIGSLKNPVLFAAGFSADDRVSVLLLLRFLADLTDPEDAQGIISAGNLPRFFDRGGLILLPGCADLYNHKTVRSSMGALFRLPAWSCTLEQLRTLSVRTGLPLLGTALREDTIDLREADLGRSIVLLGSEGRGLSEAALAACCQTIRIPMEAKCESLNVAAAAAAILWEGYRQPCASGGAAHRLRFQAII